MCEIAVVLGRFGSGKTEFALNYAIQAAKSGKRVLLADVDLVNPYFTSSLQSSNMEKYGIKLVASIPCDESVELPAEINTVFADEWDLAVLDVGGDPMGARVLGCLNDQFQKAHDRVRAYYVVNTRRPMSSSKEEICMGIEQIEKAGRIRVDYLINNTNLGIETTPNILSEGNDILLAVSRQTGIPIRYFMGLPSAFKPECLNQRLEGDRFMIHQENRPEWIDRTIRANNWSTNSI